MAEHDGAELLERFREEALEATREGSRLALAEGVASDLDDREATEWIVSADASRGGDRGAFTTSTCLREVEAR